jgi:membrane complex biogenesis BtpA family protein
MTNSPKPVVPQKRNALLDIFGKKNIIIGVVHALPLPGAPKYNGDAVDEIYNAALQDAMAYQKGGVDGVIIENHGDIPFSKPDDLYFETATTMSVMAHIIRTQIRVPMGINVLANGAYVALAIAKAANAQFVRVNQWTNAYIANEGFVEGPAGRATRYRAIIRANNVKIFADVQVKHGSHAITADRSLEEQVRDAEWSDADILITTGQRTGDPPELEELKTIKAESHLPVLVGSGVNEENINQILSFADGCIVASALKYDGVWWNRVDMDRVRSFIQKIK